MEQCTVLIADSSEEFCHDLREILRRGCSVHSCYTGMRALKYIQTLNPDVVVLDLMLPELDGVSLLRVLSIMESRPTIIATTNVVTDYILDSVENLDVDYLMVKPCSVRAVAARVQDHLGRAVFPEKSALDLQFRISGLLLMLGVSVKLHGFRYLEQAVSSMVQTPDQSMTKELYPWVANVCDTEPSHVERSIRGAILDAWKHRDERVWRLYFPCDSQGKMTRPTNTVFISRLADGLRFACAIGQEKKLDFIPVDESYCREN